MCGRLRVCFVLQALDFLLAWLPCCLQGRREDLRSVVEHLRKRFNVQYIYCWHGGLHVGSTGASQGGAQQVAAAQPEPGSIGWPYAQRAACSRVVHPPTLPARPALLCPARQACLPTGAACRPPPRLCPSTSRTCTSQSPPPACRKLSPGGGGPFSGSWELPPAPAPHMLGIRALSYTARTSCRSRPLASPPALPRTLLPAWSRACMSSPAGPLVLPPPPAALLGTPVSWRALRYRTAPTCSSTTCTPTW